MSKATDIAWAAGLFEGEGCFSLTSSSPKATATLYLRAQMNMVDEEPIRRFVEIVGVGDLRFANPPSTQKRGHSPYWSWKVSGADALSVYRLLKPHLSMRRKVCAEQIIGRVREREIVKAA